MIRNTLTLFCSVLTLALLICAPVSPCYAFQIEIKNHRLSVEASQVPLQSLLKQLAADYGIAIRMDPAINPPVTVSFQNRELEDGLRSILKPHNHVFLWKSNPEARNDPSAPPYLLDEIQIYRPGEKSQMVDIHVPVEQPAPEAPPVQQTKVTIKGNKVFVPVTLSYGGRQVQTTLLFDTGAGSIVLHQNVADQLGIEEYQETRGRGVGGMHINTKATRLDFIMVGPHKKENLRADIIEYQGQADEEYNGLLGMNFIRGLKYTIDFNNQTIDWLP